jgi:hypothetical protein
VTPPPDEFVETIAHPDNKRLAPGVSATVASYNISIPDGFAAVSGYIQFIDSELTANLPTPNFLEFFIGEK